MGTRILTFLFTDLEGSTKGWLEDESAMGAALGRHDAILRTAIERHGGSVLKHTGDGVIGVFDDPLDAVSSAIAAQCQLREDPDGDRLLRTRMAVHTGPCQARDGDYFGPTLNHAARIMSSGHGGQVLASSAVAGLVRDSIPLLDLGVHRLRDLREPEAVHQVLIDDAGRYPPLRTALETTHDLPASLTPLIGRDDDIATVKGLLTDSPSVTLVGIGGVGKTRLAIAVAEDLADRRGVTFVDLAPVVDPDGVTRAVAGALGLPPGEAAGTDAVVRAVRGRDLLIVLDNCEHVLDATADLVDEILSAAGSTSVLATSREPLGLAAERVWRVPSLDGATSAVDLFVERARAAGAEVPDDPQSRRLMQDICSQLDGIPLAVELAAARVRHLSLEDIAGRLHDRFQLLTGGRRRTRQRHQTLQAALDWSHGLLDEAQRSVLRHAAVFTGGFTLDALAQVVGSLPDTDVLDALSGLVDHSLVLHDPHGSTTRFRLLETVRLYGLDRLADAGEAADARAGHVAWVRTWLGDPRPGAGKNGDDSRILERDNVLAALEWLDGRDDLATIGQLAPIAFDGLTPGVWVDDGWRFLGRSDVEATLEGEELARYVATGAANANSLGDFPLQAELASRARALAQHGSPAWRFATAELANAESIFNPQRARDLYEELLPTVPPDSLHERALLLGRRADPALMTESLEEAAALLDEADALLGIPDFDHGVPHLLLGRFEQVHDILERFEQPWDVSALRTRRPLIAGLLAAMEGRLNDAQRHLLDAARAVEQAPVRLVDRDVVNGFAVLAHHEGDDHRAAELLAVAANGPVWSRSPGMFAVHMHYRRRVGPTVGKDEIRRLREAAASRSVEDVLAEEVGRRSGTS